MNRIIKTAVAAALIISASTCRTLTPEEAAYQREYNLRVFQIYNQGRANSELSGAIRGWGAACAITATSHDASL